VSILAILEEYNQIYKHITNRLNEMDLHHNEGFQNPRMNIVGKIKGQFSTGNISFSYIHIFCNLFVSWKFFKIFQNSQNSPKLDTPLIEYIDIKGKRRCFMDFSFKYLNISEV